MSTRVLFIRHGETRSNLLRRYMGRSDEPISSDGRYQARNLARRLRNLSLDAIYCSPLTRTRQTAEILAQPHGQPVRPDEDLMEIDLSRWQGLVAEEIAEREPDAFELWSRDPAQLELEGIEPLSEVAGRVRRALERFAREHPGQAVAAVTHDALVRIGTIVALDLPLALYRSVPVDNASLTVLELDGERNYLRRFNDVAHLDDAAPI